MKNVIHIISLAMVLACCLPIKAQEQEVEPLMPGESPKPTKYIAVDIYNPEDYTYNLYAVLQATNEWKWCQAAQSYQIGKGVHTVVYDFREFTSFLSDVRRISINCDNWMEYNKESHIYIDNIRLIK